MKDIQLIQLEKYSDPTRFEKVAAGIYQVVSDYKDKAAKKGDYVTAFSFTLEEDAAEEEDTQYPLEDLLDEYFAHVSDFIQYDPENPVMKLELCTQGWLDKMEGLVKIEGKRVYNREIQQDGDTFLELVIE